MIFIALALFAAGFFGRRILALAVQEPVALAVPLGALVVFAVAPQMPDMITGMGRHAVLLALPAAALALGLSGWFWMRAGVSAPCRIDDASRPGLDFAHRWAPRLPMLAGAAIPALALLQAMATNVLAGWQAVGGAVFLLVLVGGTILLLERRIRLGLRARRPAPPWMWRWQTTALLAAAPFGWAVALGLLGLAALGVGLILTAPEVVERVPAPVAAVLAMALSIGPLGAMLAIARDAVAGAAILVMKVLGSGLIGRARR